jgi:hypothetical protein
VKKKQKEPENLKFVRNTPSVWQSVEQKSKKSEFDVNKIAKFCGKIVMSFSIIVFTIGYVFTIIFLT